METPRSMRRKSPWKLFKEPESSYHLSIILESASTLMAMPSHDGPISDDRFDRSGKSHIQPDQVGSFRATPPRIPLFANPVMAIRSDDRQHLRPNSLENTFPNPQKPR